MEDNRRSRKKRRTKKYIKIENENKQKVIDRLHILLKEYEQFPYY